MRHIIALIILVLIAAGCKKPYEPPAITADNNFLVVEGMINTGVDSTIVKLSRTVKIDQQTGIKPVTSAQVSVESDQNNVYQLIEKNNGVYVSAGLNLPANRKYRLKIQTGGKVYQSDFVEVKISPAIDDVKYSVLNNGVQLSLDTHDTQNQTRYYRWEYVETWEFQTTFNSVVQYTNGQIVTRDIANQINHCWGNNASGDILLESTARLQQDEVTDYPLTFIDSKSEKLSLKYSILVKQYALNKDAFEYWQNLKKNTEQLGSIFDAQPSQLPSNIHCITNSDEPVLGYISAGSYSQKRIYINKAELPNWVAVSPFAECTPASIPDTVKTADQAKIVFGPFGKLTPISLTPQGTIVAASTTCVDCTIRGVNKKPGFWQ